MYILAHAVSDNIRLLMNPVYILCVAVGNHQLISTSFGCHFAPGRLWVQSIASSVSMFSSCRYYFEIFHQKSTAILILILLQ